MKKIQPLIAVMTMLSFWASSQGKTDPVAGVWKGTSICQVKGSPCHDESVVYHITPGDSLGKYTILANKIVNGQEEEMGTINAVYIPHTKTLSGTMPFRSDKAVWKFEVTASEMNGTLTVEGNTLYRKVKVHRST